MHEHDGVGLELAHSNAKGTIAMARVPSDVNSNENEWFFNVNDNPELDTFSGGYTVFGTVADGASQKVIERINKLPIRKSNPSFPSSPFNELPVVDGKGQIDVPKDLVMVTRVVRVMGVTGGKG